MINGGNNTNSLSEQVFTGWIISGIKVKEKDKKDLASEFDGIAQFWDIREWVRWNCFHGQNFRINN